jgi:hypothetical protein
MREAHPGQVKSRRVARSIPLVPMRPLYDVRIGDLGLGDFIKVDPLLAYIVNLTAAPHCR